MPQGSMRYTMTEPPEARTSATVATNMELAVVFKDTVNGIKGPSALMNLRGKLLDFLVVSSVV